MIRVVVQALLVVLLCTPCLAQWGMGPGPGVKGYAAGCSYPEAQTYTATNTDYYVGYDSSTDRYCITGTLTADGTRTIVRVQVALRKYNSPTMNYRVHLCTDGGAGYPSSMANCTASDEGWQAASGLTTSLTYYAFNWAAGYAMTNTSKYIVLIETDGIHATNNIGVQGNSSVSGQEVDINPTASCGGSWTAYGNSALNYKLQTCN